MYDLLSLRTKVGGWTEMVPEKARKINKNVILNNSFCTILTASGNGGQNQLYWLDVGKFAANSVVGGRFNVSSEIVFPILVACFKVH